MSDPGSSALRRDDVVHVARLARLALSEEELDRFTGQLASVLRHAQDLSQADLAGVPPSAHPLALRNVLRPDEPRPGLARHEVLGEAPEAEGGLFKVPPILGEAP
jgi:aspartyl-tRNA(Asn)/glutamyl-tRNA(Gln) amidotransferase subunit C